MSKLIVKVGNFITENLNMQNLTDKEQIKRKVKYNLECIVFALILLIINFLISCIPEIIPFSFNFEVFGCALTLLTLFKSFCALYYINKL